MLGMVIAQLHNVASQTIATRNLSEEEKKKIGKGLFIYEPAFGKTKWKWLLPLFPDNLQYDPHITASKIETPLRDYTLISQNNSIEHS